MLGTATCTETVSVVEALFSRDAQACIDLGTGSILGFAALFIGAVIVLKVVARAALRLIFRRRNRPSTANAPPPPSEPVAVDTGLQDPGPIRSIRPR